MRLPWGGAGVDQQSLADFEENLKDNLYTLWNRLSSGSYFPPPVKAVGIPKKIGGERALGVPCVSDRIAQMVVKLTFEPCVEPLFLPDSYGYRPNKSALDAIGITRERCWRYNWVVEYDIRGLFDHLDHALLMKAVKKHTDCKWVILYIERWLKTPMQLPDGRLQEKTQGVMQGGVISPLLSNLFLHYVFDYWMVRKNPTMPWCRYADDGLVHCKNRREAEGLFKALKQRYAACGLELHPDKTKIVYCKDTNRQDCYPNKGFTFLGYDFRARKAMNREGKVFQGFSPGVSKAALKAMCTQTRRRRFWQRTGVGLETIAEEYNPVLRGWIHYYGRYHPGSLRPVLRHFDKTLAVWAMHKFKKLKGHKTRAGYFLQGIRKRQPSLFAHWKLGMLGGFA